MMNSEEIYTSTVLRYGAFSVVVAGSSGTFRYMIACPWGSAIIEAGFSKVIDAHRAAMRQISLLEAKRRSQ